MFSGGTKKWVVPKIILLKVIEIETLSIIEISSDASFGWGAVCNNICTGGTFNLDEMEYHINAKEWEQQSFFWKHL